MNNNLILYDECQKSYESRYNLVKSKGFRFERIIIYSNFVKISSNFDTRIDVIEYYIEQQKCK